MTETINEILTTTLVGVLNLGAAAVAAYIARWLRTKGSTEKNELIRTVASDAVRLAEELGRTTGIRGAQKLEAATIHAGQVLAGYGIKVDVGALAETILATLSSDRNWLMPTRALPLVEPSPPPLTDADAPPEYEDPASSEYEDPAPDDDTQEFDIL